MFKFALLLALIMSLLLTVMGQAYAQEKKVYSWTDENGVVNFSETKPEGQQAEVHELPQADSPVDGNMNSQAETTAAQTGANEPSLADQQREKIARSRQEAEAAQAVTDMECSARRAEVEQLEPHRRVFFTNDKGETERMDNVERANKVAEAKAYIQKNCN